MKQFLSLIALFVAFSSSLWANNLVISSSKVVDQNSANKTVNIQFDISWDNSWRTNAEPNNWDAVWLFVKYKKASDSNWYHATLNTNDASHYTGSRGDEATIDARGDGKGAFFYRSADGIGTFASNQVKLCWNYGTDSIDNRLSSEITEIKVFGIEMCYIPQGAFYVGGGGSETTNFFGTCFDNFPYQITSESEISVGQTNGNLCISNNSRWDSWTIPATFPKGYNAFYCMKYEITQEQYCDFLNILNRQQQDTRTATSLASGVTSVKNRYVMCEFSRMSERNGIRCDATIPATDPISFYCDFNANGIPNESGDGQNIACNYLTWADGIAYSDWSGLRPMTELEFEKICRGTVAAVEYEYAWGSTSITEAGTGITNSGQATEGSNVSGANCNCYSGIQGPLRVGCFSGGSRQSSGASYYGVMEMSGNLYERCVIVDEPEGRSFTGVFGDGILDVSGNANLATCPGIDSFCSGVRGGDYFNFITACRTSNRSGGNPYRWSNNGFRCISGL